MIRRIKGTQDLLSLEIETFITRLAEQFLQSAHFTQIQTPLIEYAHLFKHSVGTETDIVTKEMYTFSANGTDILCLRPEATASTMRAFVENKVEAKPWNVFSIGPCFRHERPQKGRYRQFSQINIEKININSIAQDAQILSLLTQFFTEKLQLKDIVLQVNFLGTPEDRKNYRNTLDQYLTDNMSKLCSTCVTRKETNILRVFDCKNPDCQKLYDNGPFITDNLSEQSQREWDQLNYYLDVLSISRITNKKLVRGLDYYNKTVFEFTSPHLGAQSAFCGGGHYNLATRMGHKEDISSIGAAIGLERLCLLVDREIIPKNTQKLHAIIPLESEQEPLALLAHQALLRAGLTAEIITGSSVKKAMKQANKINADYALLIGPDEQADEVITVKNMDTGLSEKVSHEKLVTYLS